MWGPTWVGPSGNQKRDHGLNACVLWLLLEAVLQGQQIGSFFKGINLFGQRQLKEKVTATGVWRLGSRK